MSYIPKLDPTFQECELSASLSKILAANFFFPVIIYGETGTGKTFPIMQTCAKQGRECFRVNLSKRSNEDNLIGGFRLKDGSTYFEKGPVVLAMERGAVLLLDEMDAADPEEVLCLQSVLEGEGYYIKAINEQILPKAGFTVIATSNTKGLGDDTGKYIGTNVLNEAFLERFVMLFTVDYPLPEIEEAILKRNADILRMRCDNFISRLIEWANKVRTAIAINPSAFNHNISTRRLIHILNALKVFKDEGIAMNQCLNRFDEYHRKAFMDFYNACFGDTSNDSYESVFDSDFEQLSPL